MIRENVEVHKEIRYYVAIQTTNMAINLLSYTPDKPIISLFLSPGPSQSSEMSNVTGSPPSPVALHDWDLYFVKENVKICINSYSFKSIILKILG
mmetsp:Transcript_20157/g.45681  ORF Transcript_20157/g.45681 Transcript_20157/m.45681 type:complete len:95 (-) Transcript_20157:105-389(-)